MTLLQDMSIVNNNINLFSNIFYINSLIFIYKSCCSAYFCTMREKKIPKAALAVLSVSIDARETDRLSAVKVLRTLQLYTAYFLKRSFKY